MRAKIITVFILLLSLSVSAQPLAWQQSPNETFVFQLNNKETLKLFKGRFKQKDWDKVLLSPFASYSDTWTEQPAEGHFLLATIDENQVHYSYYPIVPFHVFLFKEYGMLTLQVVDSEGNIRKDAKVRLGFNPVYYDKESQTYTTKDESKWEKRVLTVTLDKFKAVFELNKYLALSWANSFLNPSWQNRKVDKPEFYSYLITDKNKYKPGETVRFKSYALSERKSPLQDDLSLWMRDAGNNKFRKVMQVTPYAPGGFAGEFQLVDSLKLKLDKYHTIQLRDKRGRIVANTNFRYEDYELYSNKLEVKLHSHTHYYPQKNQLEILATDANGLLLQEVEAEVTVCRKNVLNSYADILSLPDTLLSKRVILNASEPTLVDIPSDIFGLSDCSYQVNVLLLTFDNQRMKKECSATFYHSRYDIQWEAKADKLRFAFHDLGIERSVNAELTYDNGKEVKHIRLPYEEKFNQTISGYQLNVPELDYKRSIAAANVDPNLELIGEIAGDSLKICLQNPLQLNVLWYVYRKGQLLEKGSGKKLDYKLGGIDPMSVYYAEVFYFMGTDEYIIKRTFSPSSDRLKIEASLPQRIYPGQKVETVLNVRDVKGLPVPDVDLTAFAVNSQLEYTVPDFPDYGKEPRTREVRPNYSMDQKNYVGSRPLDYSYWNRLANLDALPFYQFTYPQGKLFSYVVNTPDGKTQFAPYVMKNGAAVDIYVIELNDVPCYFSWTEQSKRYSFPVMNLAKQKVTLRLHDRAIILDAFSFEPGKKTILSLDLERLPVEAKVLWLNNKDEKGRCSFLPNEIARYKKYICKLPIPEKVEYTCLENIVETFPVFLSYESKRKQNILVGPVEPGYWNYMNSMRYRHEGGFSYEFEGNVVYKYNDEELCPENLQFSSNMDFRNLNDFCLTSDQFRKLLAKYRQGKPWHPVSIYISLPDKKLNFRLPVEQDSTGVANLLFETSATKRVLCPDKSKTGSWLYSKLPEGMYNVIVLYNNGKYLKRDSISLSSYTHLDVNMQQVPLHESDSLSAKWLLLKKGSGIIGSNRFSYRETRLTNSRRGKGSMCCGYVYEPNGEPLAGCSVIKKGTKERTYTNLSGYFELTATGVETVLEFRYIGYQTGEIRTTSGMELSVTLQEATDVLEEVVVVGYENQKKLTVTGGLKNSLVGSLGGVIGKKQSSTSKRSSTSTFLEKIGQEQSKEVSLEAEKRLYQELMQLNGIRRNFSDVGFWEPRLRTDKEGRAQLTVTFPDNITRWNAVVYAMNQKLKTGIFRQAIQSYKPLMAELKTPQFLTMADCSDFAGMIRNYTGDGQINGSVMFTSGKDTLRRHNIILNGAYSEAATVEAAGDSITTRFVFTRDDGYQDGEERTIPIVPQGTELTEGSLGMLKNGEKIRLKTAGDENMQISLTNRPLDVYLDAASYLTNYKYLCNEQLASKLIGLLGHKKYARCQGKEFKDDKQVNGIIRRLLGHQNGKQLWSWWKHDGTSSFWMSAHILHALKMAKDAGYTVNLKLSKLEDNYVNVRPYREILLEDVEILHALSEWDLKDDYASAVRILFADVSLHEKAEDLLVRNNEKYRPYSFLKEKLLLWEIQQKYDPANLVSDSIRQYLKEDVLGGIYCDDGRRSRSWRSGKLENTLIAYRIIKKDPKLKSFKEAMQLYILGTKSKGWNTYQASSALSTVLADVLAEMGPNDVPAVLLGGKENRSLTTFPYEMQLAPGENLILEKKSGPPLIYSTFTMKRVSEANAGKAFEVTSTLKGDTLTAGIPVDLNVTLQVKQEGADYVMLEIPIPAGCSYASKPNYFYGQEVHREYFKEKTVIFSEYLPVGTYHFKVSLLPRYTGKYTLNPAKVELMYFPVVNANNGKRKIEIVERKK